MKLLIIIIMNEYMSPHFYNNIYFDWLVPPTYKIVPAPLPYNIIIICNVLSN